MQLRIWTFGNTYLCADVLTRTIYSSLCDIRNGVYADAFLGNLKSTIAYSYMTGSLALHLTIDFNSTFVPTNSNIKKIFETL